MRSLVKYFNGGNIYDKGEAFDFRVTKLNDIQNKIIPFFKEYPGPHPLGWASPPRGEFLV